MKQKTVLLAMIPLILIMVALIFWTSEEKVDLITTKVKKGEFTLKIYSSGQLESENSETINAPEKMKDRSLRIWELSITDMIEEGAIVDSGDYVATLDHKVVESELKKVQDEIDKTFSEYQDAKIDSNLNLNNQRDEIINARLDLEEKKIEMEQSIFESPAIQKKKKMDYDKALRKLQQEKNALELKEKQEVNKVNRKFINYRQLRDRESGLKELFESLIITAPKSGILTYHKYPWGEIVAVGSKVSSWRGIIAKIPDMSNLVSRTYINEIDISKVKKGQQVEVGIDAFPEKKLVGEVVNVANVGQSMPESDAKVFEVKIKIYDKDKDLKPSMTTSNVIFGANLADTLFIPSDAVFSDDSLQFVYLKDRRIKKQIVCLGDQNENFVLIQEGLQLDDEICLQVPEGSDDLTWEGLDIYKRIKEQEEEKKKLAEKEREKYKEKESKQKQPPGLPAKVVLLQ